MSGNETTGPDLICFAGQDWWYHNHAHSDFQLMRRIAERRTVLFVNSLGMRMPLPGRSTQPGRRILRKLRSLLRFVRRPDPQRPGFLVFTPLTLPLYSSARARAFSGWLVRQQIRLLARLFLRPRPVCFVTIPTGWDVVRHLPHPVVYNRSDKQSAFPEVDREMVEGLERSLLAGSDAVLYVSSALMEEERPQVAGRIVFLDHGVDLEHFRVRPLPEELARIPGPRIGFFGAFDNYTVDYDLLERLAVECPQASLVLIGSTTDPMGRLTRHPNVHYLGYRPYEQIPAYGSGFDVAIMPWLRNDWIEHCNPIKLKEYLALGLRTVTTPFPEARRYADVLDIAADEDDFVRLVRLRLAEPTTAEQAELFRARVLGDSWEARAAELLALVDELGT